MNLQQAKIYNQIYSILNHKGYSSPSINQNKKAQMLIRIMVQNLEISNFYIEKTQHILEGERAKWKKLAN